MPPIPGACNKKCITHRHFSHHSSLCMQRLFKIYNRQFRLHKKKQKDKETFIEEAERVMFGVLATSLEASSEFDTDRNCLGAGTGLAASLGFGGMFTGFVIRISWAMELGRNGWGETKARFWIPLKLLARSLTLMITSLLGSFSFSHSESFSFSSSTGSGGGTAELLLLLRAQKLLSSLSSSFGSVPETSAS